MCLLLPALVLDFAEQPRVLDRQHRLRRERLHQVDDVLREGAGSAAADHQHADDIAAAGERRDETRAETGAQRDFVELGGGFRPQVGDLSRAVLGQQRSNRRIAHVDMPMRQRLDQLLVHAVGGAQPKLALGVVENVDRTRLGAGELRRLGDDGREHGFEVEGRVHRLRYLTKRAQFADRSAELVGALAQLVEQPRILDGDHRLVGEGSHQIDLLFGEWPDLLATQIERTDQFVVLQHRDSQKRSHTSKFNGINGQRAAFLKVSSLCRYVDNVNKRLGCHHATDRTARTYAIR